MAQRFVFTALPVLNTETGKAAVAAHVAIQLDAEPGATLREFSDIRNWISILSAASYNVRINNIERPVTLKLKQLDREHFGNLFTDNIKVAGFNKEAQDLTRFPIKSYPVKHIMGFIENTYREVGAAKSDELPDTFYFKDGWKQLGAIAESDINEHPVKDTKAYKDYGLNGLTETDFLIPRQIIREKREFLSKNKVIPFNSIPDPSGDFAQLRNFHIPQGQRNIKKPPEIPVPDFEFHDILAVLSGYPRLQRKFGLVLDFDLPADTVAALAESGTIRIIPGNLQFTQASSVSCPAVAYIKTESGIYLQSKSGSSIEKGMLKLNSGEYTVVQYDTDGAALKLCNMADNLVQQRARHLNLLHGSGKKINPVPGELNKAQEEYENYSNRKEGLPALRSAGIGVVRIGHAAALYKKFEKNKTLFNSLRDMKFENSAVKSGTSYYYYPAEILYADDLSQGYRMDIYDTSRPEKGWFSLHRKLDSYSWVPSSTSKGLLGRTVIGGDEEDEGFISVSATQEEIGEKALCVGEVIARWEGWSLSVRKPGIAINNPGGADVHTKEEEKKKYILPDMVGFRLETDSHVVKGSLPKLRFGRTYHIKIRVVDIAGNSLSFSQVPENDRETILTGIKFRRYEPAPSPVVKYGNEIKDGESLERMVIRSNKGVSATEYENTAGGKVSWLPVAIRHFQAPRTSQFMAELHDMFEGIAMGPPKEREKTYQFIDSRDKTEFANFEVSPNNRKTDISSGDASDGVEKLRESARIIYPDVQNLSLTYLADPMAAGVVLFPDKKSDTIPGWNAEQPRYFSFYTDTELTQTSLNTGVSKEEWKETKSFRIRLEEGNKEPDWNSKNRVLTVYLDKGKMITLNYACFWRPQDIKDISGLYQILGGEADAFKEGPQTTPLENALKGKHWMISPWRSLTLVHAVQQPLKNPEFSAFKLDRAFKDTGVSLLPTILLDGKSTDKISLEASWKEYADDFADSGPKINDAAAHVASLPVDYFNEEIQGNASAVYNEKRKKGPSVRHLFGDTKHRWVSYRPVAVSRYREYFTGLLTAGKSISLITESRFQGLRDEDINHERGEMVRVNILSSAPPQVPQVEYVLPSFNWAVKSNSGINGYAETHVRTGNIRVYLKRPWYSSGEGEKLAVVLAREEQGPNFDHLFSLWGKDPVFIAGKLNDSRLPTPDKFTFPFAADYDEVILSEIPMKVSNGVDNPVKAKIAAYNVQYDADRQIYYADIPVNCNKAYYPFIKLALCRYQRNSLRTGKADCCISRIIHSDWIQIVPSRSVSVITNQDSKNRFSVSVSGVSSFLGVPLPADFPGQVIRSRIKIIVENNLIPRADQAFVRLSKQSGGTVIWQNQYEIPDKQIVNGEMQFKALVNIPEQYSHTPFRVVVEEYELHKADPLRKNVVNGLQQQFLERLVFMDVFEINMHG